MCAALVIPPVPVWVVLIRMSGPRVWVPSVARTRELGGWGQAGVGSFQSSSSRVNPSLSDKTSLVIKETP
jgi:hypothetical protein